MQYIYKYSSSSTMQYNIYKHSGSTMKYNILPKTVLTQCSTCTKY